MIRAVFFDIGNTLFFYNYPFLSDLLKERFEIDRHPQELEAVHYSLNEVIQQKVKEHRDHQTLVREVYALWLDELGVDGERIPRIVDVVGAHPFPHMFWARIGEGVRDTLEWLRERHVKLGVISNAEGQIQRLLEHVGVHEYFGVVLDSKVVGVEKPDVRIFEKALDALGVAADEALHVGDLVEADVRGARDAGITPVLVDRENRYPDIDCLRVRNVCELTALPAFEDVR